MPLGKTKGQIARSDLPFFAFLHIGPIIADFEVDFERNADIAGVCHGVDQDGLCLFELIDGCFEQ